MHRAIVFGAVCLTLLVSGASLSAGRVPDDDPLVRPVLADARPRDERLAYALWDLSHGPYADFTPSEWYSDLVYAIEANSEIVSYETTYSLQYVGLDAYDVIVIGTLLAWDSAYNAAELAAIQDFVAGGGGLLIMGENTACPNENINLISEAFGVTCPTVGSDVGNMIINFAALELFDGVSTLQLASASGLTVGAPSSEIAWASGGEAVIALVGDCDVIVTSDGDLWANDYIGLADNEACAINVFECLTGSDSPVERSSWGVIKALYR